MKVKKQLCLWKNVRRKGSSMLAFKQRLLFENTKESDTFEEMYKKNGASKSCKSVKNVSKTQSGN